ncbi:hypothetical protein NW752_007634 [Fusarium irregulare]|nr:hypothetical protein NW752_007634 [Fusarium irregulare]
MPQADPNCSRAMTTVARVTPTASTTKLTPSGARQDYLTSLPYVEGLITNEKPVPGSLEEAKDKLAKHMDKAAVSFERLLMTPDPPGEFESSTPPPPTPAIAEAEAPQPSPPVSPSALPRPVNPPGPLTPAPPPSPPPLAEAPHRKLPPAATPPTRRK